MTPGEENVDPGVGGDDDDEREEEDLAVVERVVDVRPVVRAKNKDDEERKKLKQILTKICRGCDRCLTSGAGWKQSSL